MGSVYCCVADKSLTKIYLDRLQKIWRIRGKKHFILWQSFLNLRVDF